MRFFLEPDRWTGDAVVLDPAESHHATAVLRAKAGDAVRVFDGVGRSADAVVQAVGKREVTVRLGVVRRAPKPDGRLVLAVAVPKGQTLDWIIEKAVELGAGEIVPLLTRRTVVRLDASERVERQRKWHRTAVEACKQCGQDWLPTVHAPRSPAEVLAQGGADAFDLALVASLQAGARPIADAIVDRRAELNSPPQSGMIWIGPEGDFDAAEYASLRDSGFLPVTFGPIVLRVETAALFGTSILRYELGRRHRNCDSL